MCFTTALLPPSLREGAWCVWGGCSRGVMRVNFIFSLAGRAQECVNGATTASAQSSHQPLILSSGWEEREGGWATGGHIGVVSKPEVSGYGLFLIYGEWYRLYVVNSVVFRGRMSWFGDIGLLKHRVCIISDWTCCRELQETVSSIWLRFAWDGFELIFCQQYEQTQDKYVIWWNWIAVNINRWIHGGVSDAKTQQSHVYFDPEIPKRSSTQKIVLIMGQKLSLLAIWTHLESFH